MPLCHYLLIMSSVAGTLSWASRHSGKKATDDSAKCGMMPPYFL